MLIKIFGKWSLMRCRQLCREVEETISQERGGQALSMTFLDLEGSAGRRQAEMHHVRAQLPTMVATSESGQELGRCEDAREAPDFLAGLLAAGERGSGP